MAVGPGAERREDKPSKWKRDEGEERCVARLVFCRELHNIKALLNERFCAVLTQLHRE